MGRVLAIAIVAFMSALVADSQRAERYTKQVNIAGWSTPALKDLTVGEDKSIQRVGTAVVRTTYNLGEGGPSISIPGDKNCEFRSLRSYSLDDEVFAIEGFCVIFTTQTTRSKRYTVSSKTYYGAMTVYTFVDEDRNGDFESRYNSPDYLEFTPRIGIKPC